MHGRLGTANRYHIGCVATKRRRGPGAGVVRSPKLLLLGRSHIDHHLAIVHHQHLTASSGSTDRVATIRSARPLPRVNLFETVNQSEFQRLLRFGSIIHADHFGCEPFLSVSANDPPSALRRPRLRLDIRLSIFPFSIVCQRFCTSITTQPKLNTYFLPNALFGPFEHFDRRAEADADILLPSEPKRLPGDKTPQP